MLIKAAYTLLVLHTDTYLIFMLLLKSLKKLKSINELLLVYICVLHIIKLMISNKIRLIILNNNNEYEELFIKISWISCVGLCDCQP